MSKSYRVSLPENTYDNAHYDARDDENLLAAAQRSHWLVRYGCRNGNCDACAAGLLEGSVRQSSGESSTTITAPAEKILLCLCTPLSDLIIALPSDPRPGSVDQSLRCYAQLRQQIISDNQSTLFFSLPAGRKPVLLDHQIALIETREGLLQGHIDNARSQGRELFVKLIFVSPLQEGEYYHVRYPLGAHSLQES